MARYRCYTTENEEKRASDSIQKELAWLRNRVKERDEKITYLEYSMMGDYEDLPKKLKNKFKYMDNWF